MKCQLLLCAVVLAVVLIASASASGRPEAASKGPQARSTIENASRRVDRLSSIRDARSAQATLYIVSEAGDDQVSLAAKVCSGLTPAITDLYVIGDNPIPTGRFEMPECFWLANSLVTDVYISMPVTFTLNASFPNPLLRFSPLTKSISLKDVAFGAESSTFVPDWSAFLSTHQSLSYFLVSKSNIGGTLPAVWPAHPALNNVKIDNSRLSGTIPPTLFSAWQQDYIRFSAYGNALSGNIPATLFTSANLSNLNEISLDFKRNALTGTIPSTLFSGLASAPLLDEFDAYFGGNMLTGTIPSNLFSGSFPILRRVEVSFEQNSLTGSVPPGLFAGFKVPLMEYYDFYLAFNQLSGSVPNLFDHMTPVPLLYYFSFDLSNNKLSGSLPSSLTPNSSFIEMDEITINLSNNSISGTIPATIMDRPEGLGYFWLFLSQNALSGSVPSNLFSNLGNSENMASTQLYLANNRLTGQLAKMTMPYMSSLTLDLSSNLFSGSIPNDYVSSLSTSYSLSVNLANCGLTGTIPKPSLWNVSRIEATFSLVLDNNKLTGTFPWEELVAVANRPGADLSFSASNNQITGSMNLPSTGLNSGYLYLMAANNNFSSLVVDFPSNVKMLDVSGNLQMTGSLPNGFFLTASSRIATLLAGFTGLTGDFPSIIVTNTNLKTLDLSNTSIGFCSSSVVWSNASPPTTCRLGGTNAVQCQSKYPSSCKYEAGVAPNPAASPSWSQPVPTSTSKTPTSHGTTLNASILLAIVASMVLLTI